MGRYKPNHPKNRKRKSRELNLTDSSKPPVLNVVRRAPLPDTNLFDYPYDRDRFVKYQGDLLEHIKKSRRIARSFLRRRKHLENDEAEKKVDDLINQVVIELGHIEDIASTKLDRAVRK
ncbi:hypothetical protein DVH05_019862 [Phytophthora capsici]|nr:hypothetical protein DVH05_002006 [Phytophthora capsici]KAG1689803.1 hypothetical protein DVH05_002008 [Phytophthora capsici]KAG1690038.1 hypothetical protein DVH05_001755 [Phytophthora capsici]KAG1693811.1 hypothetical protein DVH05_022914 [Phytophthora capsici]KAG1709219.1 hypothetical protein DVH05_019862 [Phytophthora capsici]